jgi:hypothetical protein
MVNILAPWIIWDRERNYRDSIVIWLVVSTILKYESQWEDDYPIYEMENKKCLKPPTSSGYPKKIDDNLET